MLRSAALVLFALAIAIGGGAASVRFWLAREPVSEASGWGLFPGSMRDGNNPYETARLALEGVLPLGRGEGVSFVARRDAAGASLSRACAYLFEGVLPAARLWTIYAADPQLKPLGPVGHRRASLHSLEILHEQDGGARLMLGSAPAPGNWLPLSGSGSFALVLTLYETPAAGGLALGDFTLPRIMKGACSG